MTPIETNPDELMILVGKQALIIHKQEVALNQLAEFHNQKVRELDAANETIKALEEEIKKIKVIDNVVEGIFPAPVN